MLEQKDEKTNVVASITVEVITFNKLCKVVAFEDGMK